MNVLYEAIMLLGRAITELDRCGWGKGELGHQHGPKCATGLVTFPIGGFTFYGEHAADNGLTYSEVDHLRLAESALVKAVPDTKYTQAYSNSGSVQSILMDKARHGSTLFEDMEMLIVRVNDSGDMSHDEIRQWFSDAMDVLAEDLPTPVGLVFHWAPPEAVLV